MARSVGSRSCGSDALSSSIAEGSASEKADCLDHSSAPAQPRGLPSLRDVRRRLLLPLILLLVLGLFVSPAEGSTAESLARRRSSSPNRAGEDYYKLLGIRLNGDRAIKKAFRKLSVQWHPDRTRQQRGGRGEVQENRRGLHILGPRSAKSRSGRAEAIQAAQAPAVAEPVAGGFDPNESSSSSSARKVAHPSATEAIKFSFGGSLRRWRGWGFGGGSRSAGWAASRARGAARRPPARGSQMRGPLRNRRPAAAWAWVDPRTPSSVRRRAAWWRACAWVTWWSAASRSAGAGWPRQGVARAASPT